MKNIRRFRHAICATISLMILLAPFGSSTHPLHAQPPTEEELPTPQIYLPFATVDEPAVEQMAVEQIANEQDETSPTDLHQSEDALNIPLEVMEANADPNAGLISQALQAAAVSGPPNEVGRWSDIINAPLVPIFTSLLPNGNVLMWDSDFNGDNGGNNETRAAVWTPATNNFTRVDLDNTNVFCSGYTHLSDGRLFVAGGNIDNDQTGSRKTHIFNYANNSWTRGPDMATSRWYPSVAALPNEELFIMGGILGGGDLHEVYQTNNRVRSLTTARQNHGQAYPFIQAAPDGRVLFAGPNRPMRMLNTNGTGSWQTYGDRDNIHRSYGSYVMYDVGRVLVSGGTTPATKSSRIIDVNDGSPNAWSTSNMHYARRQHNLTALADGTVLATGGLYGSEYLVDLARAVYAAEVWDPETGAWTELASMSVTRQYHSVALLLPDGRVMTGGGGVCGDCNDAGYYRNDMEIFEPPYLFDSSGNLADRPTISSVPSAISYGNSFTINSPDASSIDKVAMVRLGAPTHAQNMGQRYVPLSYSQSSNTLTAAAPATANMAPPGYYMLFIIDNDGVPSVAKFVNINAEDEPEPDGSNIKVWAQGQEGAERMELRIDNAVVKSWTVTTDMDYYEHDHGSTVRANQISVHFTNDAYSAIRGYDRNLTVDKMILDGTTYQTEAPTVQSIGVGTANGCAVLGFHQKELLYCNGYVKYDARDEGGDGSTIRVVAKGDEGDERIELRINGTTVASWTLSQTISSYTHTHSSTVSANQISVHFVNDAASRIRNYDRNVTIDKIVLDGVTHQTEAPSVVGKGFWDGSSCTRVTNHQRERLHCNGYYAY